MFKLFKKIKNWFFGIEETVEVERVEEVETAEETVVPQRPVRKGQIYYPRKSLYEINEEIAEHKRIIRNLKEMKKDQLREEFKMWAENNRQYDLLTQRMRV